jgi:GcrA cell cycle regulator
MRRELTAAPVRAEPVIERVRFVEAPGSATVLTLGAHMCKWPIGDPSTSEFSFCGRRASDGPYCGEHAQVAYQPAQKKGRSAASDLARSLRRYI